MEWSKMKNMILMILVVTNLILLAFVLHRQYQTNRMQEQARSQAILFLAERGVQVEEDVVPARISLQPQTAQRDLEQEGAAAARLLGEGIEVEARGAEVYRYSNDKGSIQFHSDGSFLANFTAGAFPVGEDPEADCLKVLELIGFDGELVEALNQELVFCQTWEGVPLFNSQVSLLYADGALVAMTNGRRLTGQPVQDTFRSTVSVSTALVSFLNGMNALGDVCSRIDSITEGYVTAVPLSGPMTLTPVWRIITDTGSYQMDLETGELSRLS